MKDPETRGQSLFLSKMITLLTNRMQYGVEIKYFVLLVIFVSSCVCFKYLKFRTSVLKIYITVLLSGFVILMMMN